MRHRQMSLHVIGVESVQSKAPSSNVQQQAELAPARALASPAVCCDAARGPVCWQLREATRMLFWGGVVWVGDGMRLG
jgi:hypothetical protein